MSKTKVVFRADGGKEIGLGHVVRSLALAEILKDDFDCVFAIQNPSEALLEQIQLICKQIIELPVCESNDRSFIKELDNYLNGNEIVVLDGYSFTTNYQKHIKLKGCSLVCIDDIHVYHFVSDVIINHAGGVTRHDYSLEPYTQCYFGPQYALLRPPFFKKENREDALPSLKKIFINMGGADPLNDTCRVLEQVSAFSYFEEIHVVTGASYQYDNKLNQLIEADRRVKHYSALNASSMANLMQECGMAVCPPSSVAFEYASIGGILFLKQIADNQHEVKNYFIEQGMALDFEQEFDCIDRLNIEITPLWKVLLNNQSRIFDGNSSQRLKKIFETQKTLLQTRVRRADQHDVMTCFNWANDPEVRNASYNPAPIALENHISWFQKKINDPTSHFYIIEMQSKPVGQIRFDGQGEVVISYLIGEEMRGKGFGSLILQQGVKALLKESKNVHKIIGYVKTDNIASCKAFEKAGFIKSSDPDIPYPDSVKFVWSINGESKTYNQDTITK